MAYDRYEGIPDDLRPTFADRVVLGEVARLVKETVALRHDFHTAIEISDRLGSIRDQFTPKIISGEERPKHRHLGAPPAWKSGFAAAFPWDRTVDKIAQRHELIAQEVKTRVKQVQGNAKLSTLVQQNIQYFLPSIGYSPASGSYLRRLRKNDLSILSAFDVLDVFDDATLIRLMIKNDRKATFYW